MQSAFDKLTLPECQRELAFWATIISDAMRDRRYGFIAALCPFLLDRIGYAHEELDPVRERLGALWAAADTIDNERHPYECCCVRPTNCVDYIDMGP